MSGEGDCGGLERAGRLVLGKPDSYPLAPGEQTRGTGRFPVHFDQLVGHQTGGLGAGDAELVGEEAVEPLGFVR